MRFTPKYNLLLFLFVCAPAFLLFITYKFDHITARYYILQYTVLVLLQIYMWITFFAFRYELTKSELIIKGLFYHKVIPLNSIFKVEMVRDFSIAPASSPNKITIYYDKTKTIQIAPQFRTIFITELTNRQPHVIVKAPIRKKTSKKRMPILDA